MKRIAVSTIMAALAIAVGVALYPSGQAFAADKRFIAIGTGGPTGVYFVVGQSICRMVHKEAAEGRKKGRKHGIRCAAPSTGGSTYNIGQISQGELDFGVAQSDWQYHAYNGTAPDKVKPFKKLRAVFSVHPEPYHVIVAKGSDINSFTDLKGKRFNIGNPGSGQRGTTEVLMKAYGMKKSDFKIATELTSTEQSKALCDGKIDAYGYTVGVPNAGVSVATDGCDARIINLNTAVEKKLVDENAYYAFATIPKGTYKTTTEDITTFGVKATFVTSADVPADVVYEVTRAVFENLDDFRKLHPAFANLDPKHMIKDALSAPLHPGAVKYYKEKGWM
ncbi:MAG: TAXI family TRAP transporter solute-binding subunit [Alphaproteobacteria bacterium]